VTKSEERDSDQIENNPGAFAAEQTWPTEDEMQAAKRSRKTEKEDDL
jgi:hypothetical protein